MVELYYEKMTVLLCVVCKLISNILWRYHSTQHHWLLSYDASAADSAETNQCNRNEAIWPVLFQVRSFISRTTTLFNLASNIFQSTTTANLQSCLGLINKKANKNKAPKLLFPQQFETTLINMDSYLTINAHMKEMSNKMSQIIIIIK